MASRTAADQHGEVFGKCNLNDRAAIVSHTVPDDTTPEPVATDLPWIETTHGPPGIMADLNELPRQVASSVSSVCLTTQEAPTTASAVQKIVLDWLQTFYLELGVDDEVEPAHDDLAAALVPHANTMTPRPAPAP